jgi:hypothetical protein
LREYLARSGSLVESNADATIHGEILTSNFGPHMVTVDRRLVNYRMNVVAVFRLQKADRVLAQGVVQVEEDFLPGGDVTLTESNRAAALHRVAESLARDGVERLGGGF